MTCFRGVKRVHKMATGKKDDELLQLDNKMRIWTRSGKFRKVEKKPELPMALVTKHNANANDNIHACVALNDTDTNDNIYDSMALHNAH